MPGINKDQEAELTGLDSAQTDNQQVPVRELTQTDRINRRLLVAFLQSMNQQQANNSANNADQPNNLNSTSPDDSEWNEETHKRH